MSIIRNLFSIISLPIVLSYFMPIHHPYFGLQNPYPLIQQSTIGIPLFVDESGNLYPNPREDFFPYKSPYVGPFPLKNAILDDVISDDVTLDGVISDAATSDDVISDDATSDDVISEDETSDDVIAEDATSDDVIAEDATSDDVISDDTTLDDVRKREEFEGKSIWPIVFNSNLLRKISAFDITFNKEDEDPRVENCRKNFGGTLVNDECYQYFDFPLTFEDAREFCQDEGGDLWTPDPTDAFLFYKLAYLMPEFGSAGFDDLFIGAKVDNTGHKVITIHGEDITETFLMNINDDYDDKECIALSFEQGGFVTHGQSCNDDDEFMCEYPLHDSHHTPTGIDSVFDTFAHKFAGLHNKFNKFNN